MTISDGVGADDKAFRLAPARSETAVRATAWPTSAQLNSLRGLACLLLVAFHVSQEALEALSASMPILMDFHEVMEPVRMPLFSFLSGFIYALRPVAPGTLLDFETKKVRRLLVPFLCLIAIIYAMRLTMPGDQGAPLAFQHYLLHPFSHLWFLEALFFVFAVYAIADSVFPTARTLVAMAIFLGSLGLFVSPLRDVTVLSIGDAAYILPFFSLGVLACRHRALLEAYSRPITGVLAVAVTLFFVYAFHLTSDGVGISKQDPVILAMSLSCILLLLMVFPRVDWLASIGVYSFSIYLFHTIFTAAAAKIAREDLLIAFIIGFAAAMIGPIVVEKIIVRYVPIFGFVIGKRFGGGGARTAD